MNVAYVVNQYPKVSHSFIRREIKALEALGVVVHRITIRGTAADDVVDAEDQAERERTRVLLGAGSGAWLGLAGLRTAIRRPRRFSRALGLALRCGWKADRGMLVHVIYLLEACLLREWLQEAECAHLHAHFGTNPAIVAMLCRELGGPPYSFTAHGTESFDAPQSICLGEKIARASFAAGVCEYGRSQLMRASDPKHWPRIHVVRCGIDESLLGESTPVPETRRLVCVARFSPEKAHLVLLDALERIVHDGEPVKLVLVGDGELRPEIEARIRQGGLSSAVTITGWADGDCVRQEIIGSRALIVPSFAEGLPVVIMEAMALGRPVIASNVGGIGELVESGATGWLVPPGSVCRLADAMREALQSAPSRLAQMGAAGEKRVREYHTASAAAALLRQLVGLAEPSTDDR